jgi:hypothetical protein
MGQPPPEKTAEKPIPFDSVEAKPVTVSRQPISLGGSHAGSVTPGPRPASAAPAAMPKVEAPRPAAAPVRPAVAPAPTPVQRNGSGERILGMKTFFAKLHAGSLTFLEEQIQGWLKENPHIQIKATNVTTGEVQAKVTEPNLIITVWY